ncbi:group III truncated hemoglobin [uncultured Caulobacter sp.]|uniref:group III truncated hemoglobin n=1 Tax=uncultured Caulobacter sp. TaxID=158749 RepID=UPI00262070A0|nr:group III truncated hemoglobin [uncultured Caulobacter sp.]
MAVSAPLLETLFTDDEIDALVETFYARVRRHHRLGPIFEHAIGEDGWPAHLAKLKDFWSSVLNTTGRYKGQPMVAHQGVEGLTEGLFMPWLNLFHQTCVELFDAPRAAIVGQKAERIARSLKLGLFFKPDAEA